MKLKLRSTHQPLFKTFSIFVAFWPRWSCGPLLSSGGPLKNAQHCAEGARRRNATKISRDVELKFSTDRRLISSANSFIVTASVWSLAEGNMSESLKCKHYPYCCMSNESNFTWTNAINTRSPYKKRIVLVLNNVLQETGKFCIERLLDKTYLLFCLKSFN